MNPVLKIALEIANGNQIYANRGEKVTQNDIENYPNLRLWNSLYFSKNGIEFRISNHELPGRNYMSAHNYINDEVARERGVEKLYYNNNIEVIIKNGEIVNTKLNLN